MKLFNLHFNFKFLRKCCRVVLLVQSGLIKKWMRDHWPREGGKCDKSMSKVGHRVIHLSQTFGAYMVLGVGICVSALVFIIEMIIQKLSKANFKMKKSKEKNAVIKSRKIPFIHFSNVCSRFSLKLLKADDNTLRSSN